MKHIVKGDKVALILTKAELAYITSACGATNMDNMRVRGVHKKLLKGLDSYPLYRDLNNIVREFYNDPE